IDGCTGWMPCALRLNGDQDRRFQTTVSARCQALQGRLQTRSWHRSARPPATKYRGQGMEQLEPAGELARTRAALAEATQELEQLRGQQVEARRAGFPAIEVQHRVRNLLAMVRSVFSRTIETADSLEHAAEHYVGRLDTLTRHEVRFLRDFAGTTDLEDMLRDELLRFGFS